MSAYGVRLTRHPPLRLAPHPDVVQEQEWVAWAQAQTEPLAVDLFAGGGGLSLGLEQAGFRVAMGVDNDPRSAETHQHNFGGATLTLDLSRQSEVDRLVDLLSRVQISVVAGGPPCQPFSLAGQSKIRNLVRRRVRSPDDPRRELWESFVEVVTRTQPKAALMENVPDMALGDDLAVVRCIIDRLEKAGYEVAIKLVKAWRHEVPQHRLRFMLVAVRGGQFTWPTERSDEDIVSLWDAIGDLPRLGDGTGGSELPYDGEPETEYQRRARKGMLTPVVWDHVTRPVRDDDRRAFELMASGVRYGELPPDLRRYRDDIFDDKYKQLDAAQLSRSITAHIARDGYWYIHPREYRTLTVREAARIQTFPDWYRFAGTRSDQFRQIGNAVPPALAEAVGRAILAAISGTLQRDRSGEGCRWTRVRSALVAWVERDETRQVLRYHGDPWAILVWSLLGGDRPNARPSTSQFLSWFPGPESLGADGVRLAMLVARGMRARRAVERLGQAASVLGRRRDTWMGRAWVKAASLSEVDEARVRAFGLKEDRLVASTPALRVVARLTATNVHGQRRFSDGRLVLGRVIGSGTSTGVINAAIETLGASVCTARMPACNQCPLRQECSSASLRGDAV